MRLLSCQCVLAIFFSEGLASGTELTSSGRWIRKHISDAQQAFKVTSASHHDEALSDMDDLVFEEELQRGDIILLDGHRSTHRFIQDLIGGEEEDPAEDEEDTRLFQGTAAWASLGL